MQLRSWMAANLATQGYRLAADERRALWLGLRFSTSVCLVLTAIAMVVQSVPAFLVLAAIGVLAGLGRHHPFDHVWNGAVRHLFEAPPVPASPPRRRHAFKVAAGMLLVVALLALGLNTAAIVAGGLLIAACATVTVTNFCIPSAALSVLERYRSVDAAAPAPKPTL